MRFVYEDFKSTYEELLNKANIPYLHIKRIRTMAVETFRILNDMSPPVLSDLVRIWDCSSYNFRYQNVLQVPQVRTTKYGKKSFRFAAAVLWNSFPDNFRQVSNQFKALISNWSGKDCKCNLLTSWLSFVVSTVSLSLSHWYPGSGVVLDCIDSWSVYPYLLLCR